jgi:hypothetical protein
MHVWFIQSYFFFTVAGIADLISFFLQYEFGYNPMAEMAVFTLALFHIGMHILHPHVFISKFLVAVEAVFPWKLLPRCCPSSQGSLPRCLGAGIHQNPTEQ